MVSGYRVSFSDDMLALARQVATERNDPKSRIGLKPEYEGKSDSWQMHYDAARAEIAVIHALNDGLGMHVKWDRSISPRGNTRGNIIGPEWRGFAKLRKRRGFDLALKSDDMKHFYGDIGFLVWPVDNLTTAGALEVIGWITAQQFAGVARLTAYLPDDYRLACHPSTLHPMTKIPTPRYVPAPQQAGLL